MCKISGATPGELRRSVRGRGGNLARRLAVWALRDVSRLTYSEIGDRLGISPDNAAKVYSRISTAPERSPLHAWIDACREQLQQ